MFVVLTILLLQPEPSATLDLPIAPLTQIVQEAARQTGATLKVSGADPHRRMFVQVRKMPLSRLRQALALATGGRWNRGGDAWQLILPPLQDEEQRVFKEGIEAWMQQNRPVTSLDQEGVDDLIRQALEIHKKPDTWETAKQMDRLSSRTPSAQFTLSILETLPRDEITSMAAGERRVYSLTPTSLQRRLPAAAAGGLAAFKAGHELMTERVAALAPNATEPSFNGRGFLALYTSRQPLDGVEKFLLVLSRDESIPESMTAEFRLFASDGRQVYNGFLIIDPRSLIRPFNPQPAQNSLFADLKAPLKLPPDEQELADDLVKHLWSTGKEDPQLKPITRRRLLQMDKEEPLAFGPTFVMREAAKSLGKQMVARVDDRAMIFPMAGASSRQTLTVGMAASACLGPMDRRPLEYVEEPDLVVIKPSLSREGRGSSSLDRRLLAAYLRAHDEDRSLLDPLAELSASLESKSSLTLIHWLSDLFGTPAPVNISEDPRSSFKALQLYGSLSPDQKRLAAHGGLTVEGRALNPESQKILREALASLGEVRTLSPRIVQAINSGSVSQEALEQVEDQGFGASFSLDTEPTEVLARRDIRNFRLVFRVAEKHQLFAVSHYDWGTHPSAVNIQTAAYFVEEARKKSGTGKALFATGPISSLRVSLLLSDDVRFAKVFDLEDRLKLSKAVPYTELPEPYKTQIAAQLDLIRRSGGG